MRRQGAAGQGEGGRSEGAVRRHPALPRPGTAACSTPEPLAVPPGPSCPRGRRGSLTPVTLPAAPSAAGSHRRAPCRRRGTRRPPQPSHRTHKRAHGAERAQLPAEGDGCRGRADPGRGLEQPVCPRRRRLLRQPGRAVTHSRTRQQPRQARHDGFFPPLSSLFSSPFLALF